MQTSQIKAAGGSNPLVLIVDDHPLYSDALDAALQGMFDACHTEKAGSIAAALRMLDAGFEPDFVMLDLKLPDVCGLSGFMTLRERMPEIPILVITSLTSPALVGTLMQQGAAGFLPKDTPAEGLRVALGEIAEGRKYLPKAYCHLEDADRADANGAGEDLYSRLAALTPQQKKVMRLICEGKPNKQIAYELCLAEATVKAHITALLRRLEVSNRTQAALLYEGTMSEAVGRVKEPDASSAQRR